MKPPEECFWGDTVLLNLRTVYFELKGDASVIYADDPIRVFFLI
jgi:hypothetical protein